MSSEPFECLASELAARDRGLADQLSAARDHLGELQRRAEAAVSSFSATARREGAPHLAELWVGPVEPDEKHVACLQFKVQRGRWEIVCVAHADCSRVTLVGPYRRGKPEKPCADHPLPSPDAEKALADLLLHLIREASAR
jgi:hypothetical protein